ARAQDKPATAQTDNFFADPVIVRGTGVEIHQSRLDEAISSYRAGAVSRNETINPADMPNIQRRVLEDLLMNQMLNQKATDAEKAKGKEEGDKRFEATKKRALNEEMVIKKFQA